MMMMMTQIIFIICREELVRGSSNSILSLECHNWVDKKFSGISGRLKNNIDSHGKRCLEGSPPDQSHLLREVEIDVKVGMCFQVWLFS